MCVSYTHIIRESILKEFKSFVALKPDPTITYNLNLSLSLSKKKKLLTSLSLSKTLATIHRRPPPHHPKPPSELTLTHTLLPPLSLLFC